VANLAFDEKDIEIMVLAHERAVDFLDQSGDGISDPMLRENVAVEVVTLSRNMARLGFIELVNRTIFSYRQKHARSASNAVRI
jgi:hypothetical protein